MEFFLNLCWLSLLLPAFFLWRQRIVSTGQNNRGRCFDRRPLIFFAALGCVLILLFPVISATDDLHAMRPEMEESERAFRDANRYSYASSALTHVLQTALSSSASVTPEFQQIGAVLPLIAQTLGNAPTLMRAGRAPPIDPPTSL